MSASTRGPGNSPNTRYPISSANSSPSSPGMMMSAPASWASSRGISQNLVGQGKPPAAWAAVRHQEVDDNATSGGDAERLHAVVAPRNYAVMLTCLYLSHEMALRDVGRYAWTIPVSKDPIGSMNRIMKNYSEGLKRLVLDTEVICRTAPDPSRLTLQHHVQKARLAAGPDTYVSLIYSGHGIQEPPTEAGELWCYDRSFEECVADGGSPSEYIPVLLFDLMTWSGASTCYVWDCQNAGRFIKAAATEAEEIDTQLRSAAHGNPTVATLHPAVYSRRQIHFAACGPEQRLPRPDGLPDDLFTSCLTSPLRTSLYFHNLNQIALSDAEPAKYAPKSSQYMDALWEIMPTDLRARLANELFAILHTIAWQSLDGMTYQKLFSRSGDLVSCMACGFMLSQRVMSHFCTNPESIPPIPSSTSHTLWATWDLILDTFFIQLPADLDCLSPDGSWTTHLKLVSFMNDQLSSILSSERTVQSELHRGVTSAGLSRLPIIRQAALTPACRAPACTALDACLKCLDPVGLVHAIQGGALDIAVRLLGMEDPAITKSVISIWASLSRSEECVVGLANHMASDGSTVPFVTFFLDNLEKNLQNADKSSIATCVQAATVTCALSRMVSGKHPKLVIRALGLASEMLNNAVDIVQQWGALMVAQMTSASLPSSVDDQPLISRLTTQLQGLMTSRTVENRAVAVHALAEWISSAPVKDLAPIEDILLFTKQLLPELSLEASPMVRKELAIRFERVLKSGGMWTTMVLCLYLMGLSVLQITSEQASTYARMKDISHKLGLSSKQKQLMRMLAEILAAFEDLRYDPDAEIASMVITALQDISQDLQTYIPAPSLAKIVEAAFPKTRTQKRTLWSPALVAALTAGGIALSSDWDRRMDLQVPPHQVIGRSDIFLKSKMTVQIHLSLRKDEEENFEESTNDGLATGDSRTYTTRHRNLEDSLVVAQQQIGMPWKWHMAEMSSPDPWSTLTCHSFLPWLLSTNESNDIMLWDWSLGRMTRSWSLGIPSDSRISGARFVNELHDQVVALLEIDNGDIQVLSLPAGDSGRYKVISSFRGLKTSFAKTTGPGQPRPKVTTSWWRQSGRLAVGGPSASIELWDCPAERCIQTLLTGARIPVTTLVSEPLSANIIVAGLADGTVKLYDTRRAQKEPVMQWIGDYTETSAIDSRSPVLKVGIVLSESSAVTSASANGMLNIHDLRNLSKPCSSAVIHPTGMSSAQFQPHSGLMTTISKLDSARSDSGFSLKSLSLGSIGDRDKPRATWALWRSSGSELRSVTTEQFIFDEQHEDVLNYPDHFRPITAFHPLRPFLAIGYGRSWFLRGSGVGKGCDTDSGSYTFLKSQEKYAK